MGNRIPAAEGSPILKATIIGLSVIGIGILFPSLLVASQPVTNGHTFGGPQSEALTGIAIDLSGDIYLYGATFGNNFKSQTFLAKFNASGDLIWQRSLDVDLLGATGRVVLDSTGNLFFTGSTATAPTGEPELLLGKMTPAGNLQFLKVVDTLAIPASIAVDPTTDGPIVVGDTAAGQGHGEIIAFDAAGGILWALAAVPFASPRAVAVDEWGTLYLTVDRANDAGDCCNAGVSKFDSSGNSIAQRRLARNGALELSRDIFLSAGDVYFLGESRTERRLLFAKFDTSLNPIWSEYAGNQSEPEEATRLVPLPDGTFFAFGFATNGTAILRFDSTGAVLSDELYLRHDAVSHVYTADAALQVDGSIVIAGTSYGSPSRDGTPLGPVVNATGSPWTSEPAAWTPIAPTARDVPGTVYDPGFPVDDFTPAQRDQAWFGSIRTPPTEIQVTVNYSIPDPTGNPRLVSFTTNLSGGAPPYAYRWSFGDGSFGNSSSPSHIFEIGGEYPVRVAVEDVNGRRGYSVTDIDVPGPPVIREFWADPNPAPPNELIVLLVDAYDPMNGVFVMYEWDFGDGTSLTTSNPYTSHLWTSTGIFPTRVRVTSSSGMNASGSLLVLVDGTPPTTLISVSGKAGSNGWYVSPAVIRLSASDDVAGLQSVAYRIDDGLWQGYTSPFSIQEGRHILEYRSTDRAGNVENPKAESINVDTIDPVITGLSPSGILTASKVTISWQASDTVSGIGLYEILVDGFSFRSGGTTLILFFSDGEHRVVLTAVDEAGNTAIANTTFRVDTNIFSPTGPYRGLPTYALLVDLVTAVAVAGLVLWERRKFRRPPRPPS